VCSNNNHCNLQGYHTYGSVQNVIYNLHRVTEKMNVAYKITWRLANWNGHILRRNCLLKHIIEGKLQGTRRRGRRCLLLNVPKKERSYWTLKRETINSILWRTRCGRGYGLSHEWPNKKLTAGRLLLPVGIVTRFAKWETFFRCATMERDIVLHRRLQTGRGVKPTYYSRTTREAYPGVKRPCCTADPLSQSSTNIRN